MNTPDRPQAAGLYVHVPFCSGKCPYCDFYSLAAPGLKKDWLKGIGREAALYAGDFQEFDTLYLGGGTPSCLTPSELDMLLDRLSVLKFDSGAELTIEVNPEDAAPDKIMAWLARGFSRISLGVQSFDDNELAFLGRRHQAGQTHRALADIRRQGNINLSLDLIFGLPAQTEQHWLNNLQTALTYHPEHLSCYQLTIEEGTKFHQMIRQGRIQPPDEAAGRRLFLLTSEFLQNKGYIHYEVSNYARGMEKASRHNQKYWHHQPYLGLGPSAHSYLNNVRWWNHRSVRNYTRDLAQNQKPLAGREVLTEEQILLEYIYLGLRTNQGIMLNRLPSTPVLEKQVDQWLEQQLAVLEKDRLVLTARGLVVADHLTLDLF